MSDSENPKSSRSKRRRMYQAFEDDTQSNNRDNNQDSENSSSNSNKESEPKIHEIPSHQIKIEDIGEQKYKKSLLKPSEQHELDSIIKTNIAWTMGFSVVPLPFVDSFLVSGMQLKMVDDIAKVYGVTFRENMVKAYIGSFVSSTGYYFGNEIIKSFVKKIPIIGVASFLVSPILAAATSYALAKVFIYHFELGGTLLDFKPEKMRAYFAKQFEDGKSKLSQMKTDIRFSQY